MVRILIALVLLPGALWADALEDEVSAYLRANGFENIALERGSGTLTAVASDDEREIRIIYNATSGEIISQEFSVSAEKVAQTN